MSSRSRNFRRRADDDDDDNEEGRTKPQSKSATGSATSSKPKKPNQQAPTKLLSFADDEDNYSPISRPATKSSSSSSRLNKPSSSAAHKHTASRDRVTPSSSSSSLPSNVQPQAGTYTQEALRELQRNTRTLASSRPPPTPESVILLKGLVKPAIDNDPAMEGDELDDEEEAVDTRGSSSYRRERNDATKRLGSIGLGQGRDSPGPLILDQAAINAIRAKRERLRQSGAAAPDYIAIEGGSNHRDAEGSSDEDEGFQGRIGFLGEKVESGKKGVFEEVEERLPGGFRKEVVPYDDDDEEEMVWDELQFRKGLGKRMDDSAGRVVIDSVTAVQSSAQQKHSYPPAANSYSSVQNVAAVPSIGGTIGGFPGLDVMSIPQQAEVAKKAMHDNLRRLKESHGKTIVSLTRTQENLSISLLNVAALEKSLSAAGERFIFMQKLRDFVSVICDFLQHKAPYIEVLEEEMQKLHEEHAAAILERRAADSKDEMIEVEPAVNAATSVFNKGGGSAAMIEMAKSAAQAASAAAKEQRNLPVTVDEFGRDINLQKRMDMMRRADARRRRKAQSDANRMSLLENNGSYERIEGESSTDESDSETAAYQSKRDLLLQTAEQIFSDAADEYSQLSVVVERFERWKKDYLSSYRDAYMSLSVPSIFSPYVRLELLKWDPLHEDIDFIDMNWHSLLYNYGIEDENNISPDDADANLVPHLVEKVAVPILHHEIAHCWDMLSIRETKNAVSATELVVRYVPASSQALTELIGVLHNRLTDAVSNLVVPTLSPLVMKAVPNAARVAAYKFGTSVRLMRNICTWIKILAVPVLEKLALDDLLRGKVLPHLRSIQSNVHDAVTRTERVVAALSGVWAGPSAAGQRSPKLQPLVDYLVTLGKTMEKKHISGVSESETSGLARRLKKMLVELNEYDQARAISRTFNLKEAL